MKQLPLSGFHRALGAEFVEFAGWEMPLRYTSVSEEHMAVREAAGLFDVSHMGEFMFRGRRAAEVLQYLTSGDVLSMATGEAIYSVFMNERGGVLDDVFVYRTGEEEFMVVCNASNVEKLEGWFEGRGEDAEIENISETTVMLAIQGPRSVEIAEPVLGINPGSMKRHATSWVTVHGRRILVSRSGYTGEDGFEIFIFGEQPESPSLSSRIWGAIIESGRPKGLKPCGLGARDTTRLEAGLCLYGKELDEDTTPLEAKIESAVSMGKGDFVGKRALERQMKEGIRKERIGLRMLEQGVPRTGYPIFRGDEEIGRITSGTFSPLLRIGIAMGYVKPGVRKGEALEVEIREKRCRAEACGWPFYDTAKYGHRRRM